ncbi:MAG: hypothetical protein U0Y82_01060 [Thermoleophilia bacterium]
MGVRRFGMRELAGRDVTSSEGVYLGRVEVVHTDHLGRARYVGITVGRFGTALRVVPVDGLTDDGRVLVLPHTAALVHSSPACAPGDAIPYACELEVSAHFGTPLRPWDDNCDEWLDHDESSPHSDALHRHLLSAQAEWGATDDMGGPLAARGTRTRVRVRPVPVEHHGPAVPGFA